MQPLRQSTARTFPSHISTAASRIARIIVEPVDAPEALYNKDHGASQEYMTRIKKEKGLPMACPNCGQPTIEGAKFCASCGSPLTQTTAAAPQAPAAPESDDGTMLSSAPHMAPAPQMPTAAVPLPNSAAPAAPQTTVPQPTTPQPAAQAQPTAQAQATQTVAPQAAPTQQFQYAPSPAPQPAAAPQPSQPTQQIARPAADPTITALTTPQSMKTMGASLGIGLGASVVFALLASIVFFMGNAAASNGLAGIPGFSDTASFLGNNGVSGSGPNFFQILFTVMTLGVGGSLNLKTSSQGFSLSNLGIDASHVSVTLPVGLPGVALAIGAAFGAYMLARRFALRFKWTGVISSLIVGVLSGLVLLVFAAIFPVTVGGSYSDYSASASLSGVSFRTFCMAFLLSAAGALAGYALAQYAGDSGNVFSAAWRWAHRARGFVRTLVESFAIYGVLFLVLGLVATIAMSAANHLGAGGLLLVPLLFPALPLMLISLSSFGGIAFSTSSYSVHTITLFNVSSLSQYGWILWICFVLFLLATFYIALRETARNMYDPYYAGWQHTWKAPVAAMAFWLAAEFLFTYFAAGYASSSMSMTAPMWYFLVAGIWAFLIEVAAMTFGPTLVASLPGMWRIIVGGTVQQTPQNVVDYVKSCDPSYGMKKTSATASGTTATATMPTASAAAQPANPTTPAAPAASVPQPATPAAPMPAPTAPTATPVSQAVPQPVAPTSMPNTTTGNTATGAVPLPQSPAGAASMPVAAPGAGQPLDPKTKKTILIGGIVIGALIVLGIVYGVLNSTVFSAKSVAQSYLTAIADGKYGKANGIADPQVGKDQLKLLSDAVAKADNATIANPHIDSVKTVEGVAKVNVTYSLNGKNVNDSLTINKDGSKFLLFPNWKISSPLLKTITVSVPNAVESLSVNGVDVTAKNAEKSDSGTWTLRVYPGSYKVSIGKSGYVTSGITMVRTNADSDAADLKIMPTAKLKEDLSKAVNAKLDECAKSTDYAPEGCPFGFDLYDEDYYRNFAWSISVYPKLSDIDLDYGTFSTRQGKAKCTYEEKNFDDSWESQDDSTHFTVNGSFSIRDGKLSVTIDDED